MSVSTLASLPRPGAKALPPQAARERSVRRRLGLAWVLLVLDAVTFYPGYALVVPIPHRIGQVITQGALPLALLLLLTVNRKMRVRPNAFLCLMSLLIMVALMTIIQAHHVGTGYRTARLAEFVAALWLLSPWWGRRDMPLLRYHLLAYAVLLGSMFAGLAVAPGRALASGRLTGMFWPIPPTEAAHYAAVVIGATILLWLGSRLSGRITLLAVAAAGTVLMLSHTRTALGGMVLGIAVGALSLGTRSARVRKVLSGAGVVLSAAAVTVSGVVAAWLIRGENTRELTTLTGRTLVWSAILHSPRGAFQVIFGSGLSNLSFDGLPIDSSWFAAYHDLGLAGVGVCAAMLLFLLVAAWTRPPGVERAVALFLITYCLASSVTETGLSDASTYLLDLAVAASLLASSGRAGWLSRPALRAPTAGIRGPIAPAAARPGMAGGST